MVTVLLGGQCSGKVIALPDDLNTLRLSVVSMDISPQSLAYYFRRWFRIHGIEREVFIAEDTGDSESRRLFLATFYGPGF